MSNGLPIKLGKEPLVDAVLEIRFEDNGAASNVLPGILFSHLDGNKSIDSLPASALPKDLRASDPNLKYAPLVKIQLENYIVQVGDQSISIVCKKPYLGWQNLKDFTINTLKIAEQSEILGKVLRYSVKYTNLIPQDAPRNGLNFSISAGNHTSVDAMFSQIRIDVMINETINLIQHISSGQVTLPNGQVVIGKIVDIDSIRDIDQIPLHDFIKDIDENLENIHSLNKGLFFSCLTEETIKFLEPIYE